ncbi:MAG: carbohydrate kinase family protein [Anaerolineae bacterium]|nr:carbohydrate kinase family protein [Anaerolineae bacterium]
MSFTFDFVGVGGLAYDLALRVDRLPTSDAKYPATLVGKLPGGFVANATCAAAQLGLYAGYIGWAGDDAEGAMLQENFLKWHVSPVGLVHVPGEPTPFTIVITDTQGGRQILLPAFPLYRMSLTAEQLMLVGRTRVTYTFPRDLEWCGQLRSVTQESGGLLALDVENAVPLHGDELFGVMRVADVVFLTSGSLVALGVSSLRDLVVPGQWLIMTAGSRGAYGITDEFIEPVFQPALPVPRVVDTTGAGDCFHAALLAAYLDGAHLPEALAFASAAAAIKVQHQGARGGLPTRAQVLAVLSG